MEQTQLTAASAAARKLIGPVVPVLLTERQLTYVGGGLVLGGSISTLPPVYSGELGLLLGQLDNDEWQQWWLAADQPPCQVFGWVGGPRTTVRIRRNKNSVYAASERAVMAESRKRFTDPGEGAARADADALIAALRVRFNLPEPPAFHIRPSPPTSTKQWRSQQ